MKSVMFKRLASLCVGYALFLLATTAAATCTNSNLSPWSGTIANKGSVSVVDTGLESSPSACKMQATLTGNDPLAAALVYYSDPSNEMTYHFRFYFNQDNIAPLSQFTAVQIFGAGSPNTYPASGLYSYGFQFQVGIINTGGSNQLVAAVACNDSSQQYVCLTTPITIASGNHYVEGEVNVASGTSGYFKMWLDHDATGAAQSSPDASVTGIDNSEWGGVNFAALGLGAASSGFTLNQAVSFDAFDSRRQTFIGP